MISVSNPGKITVIGLILIILGLALAMFYSIYVGNGIAILGNIVLIIATFTAEYMAHMEYESAQTHI